MLQIYHPKSERPAIDKNKTQSSRPRAKTSKKRPYIVFKTTKLLHHRNTYVPYTINRSSFI